MSLRLPKLIFLPSTLAALLGAKREKSGGRVPCFVDKDTENYFQESQLYLFPSRRRGNLSEIQSSIKKQAEESNLKKGLSLFLSLATNHTILLRPDQTRLVLSEKERQDPFC